MVTTNACYTHVMCMTTIRSKYGRVLQGDDARTYAHGPVYEAKATPSNSP